MKTDVVIKKEQLFAIETWIATPMMLIAAVFLVLEIVHYGFFFKGTIVPWVVLVSGAVILARAQRKSRQGS